MNDPKESNKKKIRQFIIIYLIIAVVTIPLFGFVVQDIFTNIRNAGTGQMNWFDLSLFAKPSTWIIGIVGTLNGGAVYGINHLDGLFAGRNYFGKSGSGNIDSVLENSHFMYEKERDSTFVTATYDQLEEMKNDGIPVRAEIDAKGVLRCNFLPGAHALIIGATGSGKTTGFISPMIQLLGAANKGSSMIVTDPKGELLDLHSAFLKSKGYEVKVFDLRDTYSSYRWNPLGEIWDMHQRYLHVEDNMKGHTDSMDDYPDLKQVDGPAKEGEIWIEYDQKAYADPSHCLDDVMVTKQKIYDEMYEDLNDIISVLCPITNEKDPLWEKGARSLVLATCLAMLEDSANPELSMSREKFNFFNVHHILTNGGEGYKDLKAYFEGRSPLSQAVSVSRQVLTAADQTFSSYMSILYDKMMLFNDRGICGVTSDTDIDIEELATKPTALFLKIPDERDTRHGLAAIFILNCYKKLVQIASAREDLSLPKNVYFILDEFGNMPKIEKFDKMITVGRSRKIWFAMVVQSYAQLGNVYGDVASNIIKSNCAMKMFIGSNDIETCKEFSELCGNETVKTSSVSGTTGGTSVDTNISTQIQVRPLIYPSELQRLNDKQSTGNAIIVTMGNFPLKTKFTPSYQCSFYQYGKMDMSEVRNRMFRPDEVVYDVQERNEKIV